MLTKEGLISYEKDNFQMICRVNVSEMNLRVCHEVVRRIEKRLREELPLHALILDMGEVKYIEPAGNKILARLRLVAESLHFDLKLVHLDEAIGVF